MSISPEIVVVETPWARPLEEAIGVAPPMGAQLPPDEHLPRDSDFFEGKSLAVLAREQGVRPVRDIAVFAGVIPDDEDVDEMLAEIYRLREP